MEVILGAEEDPAARRQQLSQLAGIYGKMADRKHDALRRLQHFQRAPQGIRLRIDDDKAASGVHRRRPAKTQGEIRLLSQQHDQVGLRQHFGERAQARVVHAARAFHAEHGRACRSSQLLLQHGPAPVGHHRAGQHQRTLRIAQQRVHGIGRVFAKHQRRGSERVRRRYCAGGIDLRFQHVHGQAQVHRPRPAGLRGAYGARQILPKGSGAACRP